MELSFTRKSCRTWFSCGPLKVVRALKSDERTRDIPIVAITASMPDEEAKIRAAGRDGFLRKPIAAAEFLARAVDAAAGRTQLLIPRLLLNSAPQTAMMR